MIRHAGLRPEQEQRLRLAAGALAAHGINASVEAWDGTRCDLAVISGDDGYGRRVQDIAARRGLGVLILGNHAEGTVAAREDASAAVLAKRLLTGLQAADAGFAPAPAATAGVAAPAHAGIVSLALDPRLVDKDLEAQVGGRTIRLLRSHFVDEASARIDVQISATLMERVLGMRHALYRQVQPFLTVHTGLPQPNLAFADRTVLLAMGLAPPVVEQIVEARQRIRPDLTPPVLPGGIVLAAGGTGTYSVSSRAARADGLKAELEATVRVGAGGFLGQIYTPLTWRYGQQH